MTLALILKEWKSLGRWAFLAGVLIGLGLIGTLFGNRPTTILTEDFLGIAGITLWGAALVAGFGVMLGDLRRGHFAFAVFRPMPRWRIFLAKFIAAALLYGVASTIAVVMAGFGAAEPRLTRWPFDIAMLLPTLYLQIGGLAWVACGMVIAARRASWIGSRLFPAVLPGAMAALGLTVFSSFTAAVLIMLLTTTVLVAVGCAYFTANGEHRRVAWWARPVAGLCVLGGVATIVGGGFAFTGEVLTMALGGRSPDRFNSVRDESYQIGDNGEAIRNVFENGDNAFFDLNGNRVPRPTYTYAGHEYGQETSAATHPAGPAVLQQRGFLSLIDYRDPDAPFYYRHRRDSFLTAENYAAVAWASEDMAYYYMPRRRTLEAYSLEGQYVGCLGPDGTFDTTGRRLPFPPDTYRLASYPGSNIGALLYSDTVAYLVKPDERKVRTIFTSTPDEPILDVTMLQINGDVNWQRFASERGRAARDLIKAMEPRVAVTTPGKLHVAAPDGGPWMVLPVPGGFVPQIHFVAFPRRGPTTPDVAVLTYQRFGNSGSELVTLRDGVVTSQTLPSIPWPSGRPKMWSEGLWAVAMPPAVLGLHVYRWMTTPDLTLHEKLIGMAVVFNSVQDVFFFSGLVLGVAFTALLARRYRLDRRSTLTWLGLALLVGIHTPLALICLRERPRRTACPACGKKRPIEEAACPHCGAAWPVPGNAATDVIEGARAA